MTSPGYCCYGCWRKAHGLSKSKSGKRHYNYCSQQTITSDLVLHVRSMKLVYAALDRRRNEGVSGMTLACTLPISKDLFLLVLIHGMEPELSTDPADFEGILPDPRYPSWDLQLRTTRRSMNVASELVACFGAAKISRSLNTSFATAIPLAHTLRIRVANSGPSQGSFLIPTVSTSCRIRGRITSKYFSRKETLDTTSCRCK